jgi:hypothetical protein
MQSQRTRQLRHRYLTLLRDALHASSTAPLPGSQPSWDEIGSRYTTSAPEDMSAEEMVE